VVSVSIARNRLSNNHPELRLILTYGIYGWLYEKRPAHGGDGGTKAATIE